jgi:hypothetical protein
VKIMADRTSGNWTIELRVYPIPGIAYFGGHMFWVLKDPSGNVRQALHFFGRPGSKLPFDHQPDVKQDDRYVRGSIREPLLQYSAPYDEIVRRWQAGISAGQFLNETYEFDYPTEWETIKGAAGDADITNSNAGAYSIGRIILPELVRKEKSTTIPTPGWGVDLFEYYFPKDIQSAPDDAAPKEDVRPDFRNETRNDGRTRHAKFSGTVQPVAYGSRTSDDMALTPAAALRAIERAKADDAFGKRYVKGDRDAVDYLHALHRVAYAEPEAVVGPRVRPDLADATPDDLSTRDGGMTPARRALELAKADSALVNRYLDGDRDAFAHMQSLIRAAYPELETLESDLA